MGQAAFMQTRTVFIISDSTGITVQTLTKSLLSQFNDIEFDVQLIRYVDTEEKAIETVRKINAALKETHTKPIIFDTVVDEKLSTILAEADGLRFDVLGMYLTPLQMELASPISAKVGLSHSKQSNQGYENRIDAVHFAMENDDGAIISHYDKADLILVGVSRCGKTPTCLYLALQFGIYAANYPITEEDMEDLSLPKPLKAHKDKLFGLTIAPDRLSLIRNERRANSKYASLRQCENEVREVEAIYRRYQIPFINTTDISIEEISATILDKIGHKRQ
jgi:hypothetical protein